MAIPQLPPRQSPAPARPVYPSDRTRSLRRKMQREAQKDERKQRYSNLAQRLMGVADELGTSEDSDLHAALMKVINRVYQRGSADVQQDYERVLDAITQHGCNCVEDIHDQTGIPKAQIWKILDGLITTKQVEERGGQSYGERKRDDVDTLFFATGTPSFSPMVRP
jgi:hypothetical protein